MPGRSRAGSRTSTGPTTRRWPEARSIVSAPSMSERTTAWPTVPQPSRPMRTGAAGAGAERRSHVPGDEVGVGLAPGHDARAAPPSTKATAGRVTPL